MTSIEISGILGPLLMVIPISEYMNFKIWETTAPALVYLNGFILFIGGLVILRFHNLWAWQWTLAITLSGWLIALGGVYRMFFPSRRQAGSRRQVTGFLLVIFLVGCFLTYKGYF